MKGQNTQTNKHQQSKPNVYKTADVVQFNIVVKKDPEGSDDSDQEVDSGNVTIVEGFDFSLALNQLDKDKRKNNTRQDKERDDIEITELEDGERDDNEGEENDVTNKNYKLRSRTPITPPKPKSSQTKEIKCMDCDTEFINNLHLRKHIRNVHCPKYTCSICGETFKTNSELISHKKVHATEDRTFKCRDCYMRFRDHCEFLLHETTHTTWRGSHTCPECYLSYKKSSYIIHILTHFDRPLSCPKCPVKVQGEHNLRMHMGKHRLRFECPECGKVLTVKGVYETHMTIHTRVKAEQCLYCGKCFRTRQQKMIHTRKHTNERPHTCEICVRKFIQCGDLKRHMKVHKKD